MFAILLPALTLTLACGCSHDSPAATAENAQTAAVPEKGGAQLWAENCSRCHNMRPPQSYSDAQWHAVVHHMRLRANLTGEEARSITAFLQASH
jgi:cytochrome c1